MSNEGDESKQVEKDDATPPKGFDAKLWYALVDQINQTESKNFKRAQALRRRNEARKMLLAGTAAIITGTMGLVVATFPRDEYGRLPTWLAFQSPKQTATAKKFESYDMQIRRLSASLGAVEAKFGSLATTSTAPPSSEVAAVKVELEETRKRLKLLEDAVSASPEKALSLPLIRRDVEYLDKRVSRGEEDIRTLGASIESIRTLIVYGMWAILILGLTTVMGWIGKKVFFKGTGGNGDTD